MSSVDIYRQHKQTWLIYVMVLFSLCTGKGYHARIENVVSNLVHTERFWNNLHNHWSKNLQPVRRTWPNPQFLMGFVLLDIKLYV